MAVVAIPAKPLAGASRTWLWIGIVLALLVLVGGGIVVGVRGYSNPETLAPVSQYHTVTPMDLDIKVAKDGELQAVNNIEVTCQVEGQTTLQSLVLEGTSVKKGDVLVTLDSSLIKQKIEDTTLDLQKSEADVVFSREMKDIQESQNATNLEAAQVGLLLAKLDVQQYNEGTYPQQLENAKTTLEMAKITLKNRDEDLDQTRGLYAKGFVTQSDVKKSELDVTVARNDVAKAQTALLVLEKYQHEKDLASFKNALAQAEARLVRVQKENASQISQRVADVRAKEQSFALLKRRFARLQEQEANCTIRAPENGLVVYASSGDRNARDQIQEGATVREKQPLLRLPDIRSMKAVLRVQEAQVPRLSVEKKQRATVKIVGVPRPVAATLTKINPLPDNAQRWWNPDLKEYPVELTLDETPQGLKPGVGVQAEILIARLEQVIAVPIGTIYSVGRDSYVFVRKGADPEPRKVALGQSNETHMQIKVGLAENEQIALLQPGQGRALLEKAGIKVEPASKPSDRRSRPR